MCADAVYIYTYTLALCEGRPDAICAREEMLHIRGEKYVECNCCIGFNCCDCLDVVVVCCGFEEKNKFVYFFYRNKSILGYTYWVISSVGTGKLVKKNTQVCKNMKKQRPSSETKITIYSMQDKCSKKSIFAKISIKAP